MYLNWIPYTVFQIKLYSKHTNIYIFVCVCVCAIVKILFIQPLLRKIVSYQVSWYSISFNLSILSSRCSLRHRYRSCDVYVSVKGKLCMIYSSLYCFQFWFPVIFFISMKRWFFGERVIPTYICEYKGKTYTMVRNYATLGKWW